MLDVTKQRPMNNEYGWHFKISQQIFINIANKKPRGQPSDVIMRDFPLSGKRNNVVELRQFSAKQQRANISWDYYLTP